MYDNQTGTNVTLRYFTSASSTGTPDTTAPALSSAASAGATGGDLSATDTLTLTFSEALANFATTTPFTDVKKATTVGTITADFASQGVNDGILLSFGTVAGVAAFPFTPTWTSSTILVLTAGTAVTAGTGPTGL